MSQMQFYSMNHTDLRFFVRHYWSVKTSLSTSPALLLPMDHVDLILCPPGTFAYGSGEQIIVPEGFHFHGLRRTSISVRALKETRVWGVSFQPWGFQPMVKVAMNAFTDRVGLLHDHHPALADILGERMADCKTDEAFAAELDEVLGPLFHTSDKEAGHMKLISGFTESLPESIQSYCESAGISRRHFERLFNHYVGVSPKNYLKIRQFELSSRELLYKADPNPLTTVGIDSGYYDQSHFIRHFKEHTSFTPRQFHGKRPALKSHLFKKK
jgi:AraC-like DNA-binding protein